MMLLLLAVLTLAAASVVAALLDQSRFAARGASAVAICPIESLEPRIAPAALAVLRGGVLTISGDPDSDSISIGQNPGGTISVSDGITLLDTFTGVSSIVAKPLGNTLFDIDLSAGGITGALSITASGPTIVGVAATSVIGGAFTFTGEGSSQSLTLRSGVSIGGALNFNAGAGSDTFLIEKNAVINGNATFTNVETGDFTGDAVATIRGALAFKNAAVLAAVDIGIADAGLAVAGKVTYAGGKGNDLVTLGGLFESSITFTDSTGNNSLVLVSPGLLVKGSVAVTTGAGNDTFNIPLGTVNGDLTMKLGNGNNRFNFGFAGQVTVGGNLTMLTGGGEDIFRNSGAGVTVGKSLTIKLGDGADEIYAAVDVAGSKATIDTGAGADTVGLFGSLVGSPALAFKLNLGAGDDEFTDMFPTTASAVFVGGTGRDTFSIGAFTAPVVSITGFEVFA